MNGGVLGDAARRKVNHGCSPCWRGRGHGGAPPPPRALHCTGGECATLAPRTIELGISWLHGRKGARAGAITHEDARHADDRCLRCAPARCIWRGGTARDDGLAFWRLDARASAVLLWWLFLAGRRVWLYRVVRLYSAREEIVFWGLDCKTFGVSKLVGDHL